MAIADDDLYTGEFDAVNAAGGVVTVRMSGSGGGGFTTGPADSPPSTLYFGRMAHALMVARSVFGDRQTSGRSSPSVGEIDLWNDDYALDALRPYAFDGQRAVIRRGQPGAAYPAAWKTVLDGTMHAASWDATVLRLNARDAQKYASVPFQPNLFLGNNVAPDGLEGTPGDLKGKPKPVLMGRASSPGGNFSPPCVNAPKLIFQISDGPIASVLNVYDKGLPLGSGYPLATRVSGTDSWTALASDGAGTLVAVGINAANTQAARSTDGGLTWALSTVFTNATAGAGGLFCVTWASSLGLFIAGGNSTVVGVGAIYTSPTGAVWTLAATGGLFASPVTVVSYNPVIGKALAGSSNGTYATSTTGTAWSALVISPNFWTPSGMTVGKAGKWFLVGHDGTLNIPLVASSIDGTTWIQNVNLPPAWGAAASVKSIAYNPLLDRYLVVVNAVAAFASSEDGVTWTPRASDGGSLWFNVASTPNGFISVGVSFAVATSPDGLVMTMLTSGGTGSDVLTGVVVTGTNIVTVGTHVILSSGVLGLYASAADLLNDALAPAPGSYKVLLTPVAYLRLGSTPIGKLTVDALEGATAADRTAGQLFKRFPMARAGLVAGTDFSTTDIAALDAADPSEIGRYYGENETDLLCGDVADEITETPGAAWFADGAGVLRIKQLTAPSGAPVLTIDQNDMYLPLAPVSSGDGNDGIPPFRHTLRWGRNYAPLSNTDFAATVSPSERTRLAAEWREAKAESALVQTAHPLSLPVSVDTLYQVEANAQAEATRRQTLLGADAQWYECGMILTAALAVLELGDVVRVVHNRFGMAAGVLFRVMGIKPEALPEGLTLLTITLWSNLADATWPMLIVHEGLDASFSPLGPEGYAFVNDGAGNYVLTAGPISSSADRLDVALVGGDLVLT